MNYYYRILYYFDDPDYNNSILNKIYQEAKNIGLDVIFTNSVFTGSREQNFRSLRIIYLKIFTDESKLIFNNDNSIEMNEMNEIDKNNIKILSEIITKNNSIFMGYNIRQKKL